MRDITFLAARLLMSFIVVFLSRKWLGALFRETLTSHFRRLGVTILIICIATKTNGKTDLFNLWNNVSQQQWVKKNTSFELCLYIKTKNPASSYKLYFLRVFYRQIIWFCTICSFVIHLTLQFRDQPELLL